MRQGQQQNRNRGRGRNRKGQSPLTRSFESTGPDVKIRGTPAHIAEKYMSLARDATSSGDPVLAENYLQHAEHYNRIIMAFRDQQLSQGGDMMNGGVARHRPVTPHDALDGDEFGDDDGDQMDMQPSHAPMRQNEPQPRVDGHRMDNQRSGGQDRFRGRQERGGGERGYRPQRQRAPEVGAEGGSPPPSSEAPAPARERFGESHEQPEFLRRPVRRPRRESAAAASEANGGAVAEDVDRD
jgi:hypothetical protein